MIVLPPDDDAEFAADAELSPPDIIQFFSINLQGGGVKLKEKQSRNLNSDK